MTAHRESPDRPVEGEASTQTESSVFLEACVDGVLEGHACGWLRLRRGSSTDELVATVDGVEREASFVPRPSLAGEAGPSWWFRVKGVRPAPGCPVSFELRHGPTGELAPGMPWSASVEAVYGHLDGVAGTSVVGWASRGDGTAAELELLVDGSVVSRARTTTVRAELLSRGITQRPVGFEIPLPDFVFDGAPHSIAVRIVATDTTLPGSLPAFRFAPVGALDRVQPHCVEGWVFNPDSLDLPMQLELFVDGAVVSRAENVVDRADVRDRHGRMYAGFLLRVPPNRVDADATCIMEIRLRGRAIRALDRPQAVVPRDELIRFLEGLATRSLLENHASTDIQARALDAWLRTVGVPALMRDLRDGLRDRGPAASVALFGDESQPAETRPVAVIVPVYRGFDETRACIESVLRAQVETPYRLVVLNDASPEPALTEWLRQASRTEPRMLLVENADNLGFVGTVNRGMALAPRSDVVLLNSDTEVPDGWLDALVRVARAQPDIGTVTPLSNRATICSVPRSNVDNDLPPGMDVNAMHRLCAARNGDESVDIPTAVGFCMYIRRAALDQVGELDEKRWKKGYGEENDFCFRARAMGWRNVAATGCFVLHHGSVSFGAEKMVHVTANLAQLNTLYPDYDGRIRDFIAADPLRGARTRINLELLREQARPRVLHVVHDLGGGTDTAVAQIAARLADEGIGSLIARPRGEDGLCIVDETATHDLVFDLEHDGELIDQALASLGIRLVHIHHAMGIDARIFVHTDALPVPRVASVHDYHWVCPRVNLLDARGRFCDMPEASVCDSCVKAAPIWPEVEPELEAVEHRVASYRALHAARLRTVGAVLCPSEDTAARMRRAFPELPILARPHPDRRRKVELLPEGFDPDAVVVIGAIGDNKGYATLARVVEHAEQQGSSLRFFVAGYTRDDASLALRSNVRLLGRYDEATLAPKLLEARAKLALFLSPWPETYSYTLSEALSFGLYPIALDLGAMSERIAAAAWGRVLPPTATPSEILAALGEARERVGRERSGYNAVGTSYGSMWHDYYGQPEPGPAR